MFDFLENIDKEQVAFAQQLSKHQLGANISFPESEDELHLNKNAIVIVAVPEYRGSVDDYTTDAINQLNNIRETLYAFYMGNWSYPVIDLGTIKPGKTIGDTYYALKEVVKQILLKRAKPIILGGSQDLTFYQYRAFDEIGSMVNMVNVDARFDLGDSKEELHHRNYLSHIIVNKPYNLFNHSNIGYQTYFNPQEEIDLLDRLYFETYRLGEVVENIKHVEPVIRDADIATIDCDSIKTIDHLDKNVNPNGFNEREICNITRYMGLSDKTKTLGLYELKKGQSPAFNILIAQMIWYFIEGCNYEMHEDISTDNKYLTKHIVPISEEDLIFYHSQLSDRWWIEIPHSIKQYNKLKQNTFLPCSKDDYLDACDQIIPERWYKAKKKNLV